MRTTKRPVSPGAWVVVLAALLAPWRVAVAEETTNAPPGTGSAELVEEIEVKGTRSTGTTSLEVREVRETAARDVGEALDGLAEVSKIRKAGVANDVVLRGLKKDDIAVLIDGQELHGSCPGRMDPPAFHLDYAEVDSVAVKKGPFDVTHPGGMGGLVEVHTRGTRRPGLGAELNLNGASAGARETSGVVAYEAGRADVLLGLAYKAGAPFVSGDGRSFTEIYSAASPSRFRSTSGDQTAYDVRSVWGKVGFAPAAGQRLELSYTRQASKDVLYPTLSMDGVADDTDRLNVQYELGPKGALRRGFAQVYWNRVVHDMTDERRCSSAMDMGSCSGALGRPYSMRGLTRATTLGARLEVELPGGWLAGADFGSRNWDGKGTRVADMMGTTYTDEAAMPDVTIDDLGLFGQVRRALAERLSLTIGARLDVAHAEAGVDRSAVYTTYRPGEHPPLARTDVLASGNVQLELDLARGPALFLGFGHGTRMPDQQELYYASTPMMEGMPGWVGNPGLRPARNDELDLGAKLARAGLLVKAQLFHAWLTDHISLVTVGAGAAEARSYANVSARTWGGEAYARVSLPLRLFASAGLSYTRGVNETAGGSLAEIPPLKGTAALRFDARWLFVEVEEVVAARQSKVGAGFHEEPTGGWAITNVKVGGAWRGVKLFAGVRNTFDRYYFEHLAYQRDPYLTGVRVPEPGRTLYVNAQYQR